MYLDNAQTSSPSMPLGYHTPTFTERLNNRKKQLESELEKVNSALASFEKNPDIANVLDLLGKIAL